MSADSGAATKSAAAATTGEATESHRPDAANPQEPHTHVHGLARRFIEPVQDVLVVALMVTLFGAMLRALLALGAHVVSPAISFRTVLAEALFILVLVEFQRLLVIYLRDHHVPVDVMVEVSIVAALREILFTGTIDIEPLRLIAITAFIIALGVLLRYGDLRAPRPRIRDRGASPLPVGGR